MKRRAWAIGLVIALVIALVAWRAARTPAAPPPAHSETKRAPTRPTARASVEPIHLSEAHAATPAIDPALFVVDGLVLATDTNSGIAGASIVFSGAGQVSDTLSVAGGRFHFTTHTPGTYQLSSITARGYVSYAPALGHSPIVFFARPGVHLTGVTLFLNPGVDDEPAKAPRGDGPLGSISGQVVDEMGAPVIGALVSARHGEVVERVQSDASGGFTLLDLPAGSYHLHATHPDWIAGEVAAVAAGTSNVRIQLGAGGSVSGTVRDAETGQPVVAFLVAALVRKGSVERGETKSMSFFDQQGHYEITGLRAGTQCLTALANGRAASKESCIDVTAGNEAHADFTLSRGARLIGHVVDRATRSPIAGARVSLENALGLDTDLPLPVYASAETDGSGRFELDGLDTGVRSIFVVADGHHSRVLPGIHLDADRPPPDLEVDLLALQPGETPSIESAGINAAVRSQGDELVIDAVSPGGGAALAGLLPGDVIVSIDGIAMNTLDMQSGVEHLRGPEGSTVTVGIRRPPDGSVQSITVTRKQIVNR